MIVRNGSKFEVRSADGSRLLGSYSTRKEAEDRLAQVEYFKKSKGLKGRKSK